MHEQRAKRLRESEEAAFALHAGERISFGQFRIDVCRLCRELEKRPEICWGLYCEDSYCFAVSLFAMLLGRKSPVILPNFQSEYIDSLSSQLDALITDKNESAGNLSALHPLTGSGTAGIEAYPFCLEDVEGEVWLFTSGSTGEPKLVKKKFQQLRQEVYALDSLWGESLRNAVVFSTVSHQHIYGLLFKILWPILTGHCFDTRTHQYPELMVAEMAKFERVVLVSSPAHLKRVPYMVDLASVKNRVTAVFSSGGPLPNEIAIDISRMLNIAVVEVFGSTETGGVAHRTQTKPGDIPWTPLPSVEVRCDSEDDSLLIFSPYEGSEQWYKMGDIVDLLADSRFMTRGRADKIVKVEEKRLSLTELEHKLSKSAFVQEVAATVLKRQRHSVAVAAVLTRQGSDFLQQHGRKSLCQQLQLQLTQYFEAVVLPKKWRFVERLPVNDQGKVTQSAIECLFSRNEAKEQRAVLPTVKSFELEDMTVRIQLDVPVDLLYFNGHFPNQPVLPGVVQLSWAVHFGKQYLSVPENFKSLEAVKFHKFIEPGDSITLNLNYNASKQKLYFCYESLQGIHSSGRLAAEE